MANSDSKRVRTQPVAREKALAEQHLPGPSQGWFPVHHHDLEVACLKATSRSLTARPTENHQAAGTPSAWHLQRFLDLSGCCLLGELLLGADLGNGCSLVSICPGTWHSVRTELSEPFWRKGASPDSLAQVQCHTRGCHSSPRTSSSSLQGHWGAQGSPRHFWHLMTGLVCTRREEKSVQWAEEAVAKDKHQSHMDQAQHTTLSVEKPKQNNHLSSLLQWY